MWGKESPWVDQGHTEYIIAVKKHRGIWSNDARIAGYLPAGVSFNTCLAYSLTLLVTLRGGACLGFQKLRGSFIAVMGYGV